MIRRVVGFGLSYDRKARAAIDGCGTVAETRVFSLTAHRVATRKPTARSGPSSENIRQAIHHSRDSLSLSIRNTREVHLQFKLERTAED